MFRSVLTGPFRLPNGLARIALAAALLAALCAPPAAHAQLRVSWVERQQNWNQTGNGNSLSLDSCYFYTNVSSVNGNDFARVTMTYPGSGSPQDIPKASYDPSFYSYFSPAYPTLSALNNAYPTGTYTFTTSGGTLGTTTTSFTYTSDQYPVSLPYLTGTDYTDLQGMDPSKPFTLHFSSFNGYGAGLSIYGPRTDGTFFYDAYPTGSTPITIPGNTFLPNSQYYYTLFYVNDVFQPTFIQFSQVTHGSFRTGAQVVQAPTANPQSVTTNQDTAVGITLTGSDPNTPPRSLTYTVVSSPAHGTLSGTAPNLTYTPTAGYSGADSFTFKVNNGVNVSNTATVSITVNPVIPAGPTDVSGIVTVTRGAFVYDRASGTYTQLVTLTNTSGAVIDGPISLILSNLTNGTLANATGTTSAVLPGGRPYINLRAGSLAASGNPGASATLTLRFTKTETGAISYTRQVVAGPGTR